MIRHTIRIGNDERSIQIEDVHAFWHVREEEVIEEMSIKTIPSNLNIFVTYEVLVWKCVCSITDQFRLCYVISWITCNQKVVVSSLRLLAISAFACFD